MELSFVEQSIHVSAKAPGYLEYALKELEENGKVDGSVSAEQLRDALENEKIKLVAKPHAGIDLMLSSSQTAGDVYTQMQWTVLHASQGSFLTSDAPVIRRDPGHREEGFFGRGLMSPTAEVWFPLSKSACLTFRHDEAKLTKFIELLATGRKKEIEAIRRDLSPITSAEVQRLVVDAVNNETILNADRFVYSPFQSDEISRRFKGESHNMRIVVSSPFKKKKKEDDATGAR
jgi:hypothetical protein